MPTQYMNFYILVDKELDQSIGFGRFVWNILLCLLMSVDAVYTGMYC